MSNDTDLTAAATYHHGNLRNALIAQGRLQLELTGPQELSMRALAKAVGVSEAAPSRHFAGKAGLLAAIAAEGFRELVQIRRKIIASGVAPLDAAFQMMASYVEFAQQNRGLFNLMTGPRITVRDEYPELGAESAKSFGAFASAVDTFARSCGWVADDLALVAHGAWAVEHGLATLILSDRVPRADVHVGVDPMIAFAISMYLSAIQAGPAALRKLLPAEVGGERGAGQSRRQGTAND